MEQAAYHGEPCEFSSSCDAVRIGCAGTVRPRAGTKFSSPDVAHQLARREDAMYTRVPVEVDRPGSGGRMIWRGSRVRECALHDTSSASCARPGSSEVEPRPGMS